MKISNYFKSIKLDDNLYAIYNSLIMDIIYVNKEKYNDILKFNVSPEEIEKLRQNGIYVKNEKVDQDAIDELKNRYNKISGKIRIMYLILSSSCNLGCKYCFIENCQFNNKKEINMSIDTAKIALEKYTNYLKQNKLRGSIIFYGGEPTINWKTLEYILNYARELNSPIDFSMVTNATLLTPKRIKFLSENKVEIGISIDGPKKLNDFNRIYRGNDKSVYDEVIRKFPLLNINKCRYGLSITVSESFLEHQDEVLKWLKNLGITSIFYNLYHYTSYTNNWKEYYERASKFLLKSYDYLTQYNVYDGRVMRKIDSVLNNEFKFSDCGSIGANQIAVKPNGDICICHGYLKSDKYVIGNIKDISFEDLINSKEMNFWKKRNTLNNSKCLNCEALFMCGGGCAIQAEALFGNRNEIDKPFCIHTKQTLKWILKKSYSINKNNIKEKEVIE